MARKFSTHKYSTPAGLVKVQRILSDPKSAHTLLSGRLSAEWNARTIANARLQPAGHVFISDPADDTDFKHGFASFLPQDTVDSLLASILAYFARLEINIASPAANQALYERCLRDLVALGFNTLGSSTYVDSRDDDVAFPISYAFNDDMHACMYYYLPLATVDCRYNWTIVRAPRWVYHTLHTLLSLQMVSHGDHMFTYTTEIGLPFRIKSDEVLAGALSLWDTSSSTLEVDRWVTPLYREFPAAMVASDLLHRPVCKTSL